ncbi:MAG: hypothetical protein WDZ49_08815 [Litorilinea sp.]
MNLFLEVVISPVGPALILLCGALAQIAIGRWVRRPGIMTGLALFFVALALVDFLLLRAEPVVPTFSRPWQPPLQFGTNLVWVGDGWNWYISGLLLILGGIGILLNLNSHSSRNSRRAQSSPGSRRVETSLAIHLSVLAAGLLFVGSANVLTVMLTWVLLDLFALARGTVDAELGAPGASALESSQQQAKGLSLIGALLLLLALLPAGVTGPGQPLDGGTLPPESLALMLLAAMIRAGIYPFHLWLLPPNRGHVEVSERLLDHMAPVLCGLWLLGWTVNMGAQYISMQPDIVAILCVMLLASAIAAWTAADQPNHTTFVLITSAGLAALAGVLAHEAGPLGMIWPTTAFALGGALWLVGDEAWKSWRWQIPVSVGALALAGMPFTPGFLTQPALARMLVSGPIFIALFGLFSVAQGIQIAAMLRSWSDDDESAPRDLNTGVTARLLAASTALGLILAIVGFFPGTIAGMASLPDAIPPTLGNPPSVVAEFPVWIAASLPLIFGLGLVAVRPVLWSWLGSLPDRISGLARLEWLFRFIWWGINRTSDLLGGAMRIVEGTGYMGWVLVIGVMAYLLIR